MIIPTNLFKKKRIKSWEYEKIIRKTPIAVQVKCGKLYSLFIPLQTKPKDD